MGLKTVITVKNDGKNNEKDNKFKKKSYIPSLRVGLDGDVDEVDRKTSSAQEEATKVGPAEAEKKTISLLCSFRK